MCKNENSCLFGNIQYDPSNELIRITNEIGDDVTFHGSKQDILNSLEALRNTIQDVIVVAATSTEDDNITVFTNNQTVNK